MASPADILDEVFAVLERAELEPDPARDWTAALPELAALRGRLEEAMAGVGQDGPGEERRWCADVAGMLAAACLAAGKQEPALRLLGRAEALAGEGAQRDGFVGALRDPEAFRRLVHDAWRARAKERPPAATKERAPVATRARAPAPPAAVPEPPPGWPEKSWLSDQGWRWLVFAGMLALVGGLSARACLKDPERVLAGKLAEAQLLEQRGTPEQALRRYERLLDDFAGQKADLSPVGAAIIRILADRLPRPLTMAELDRAHRVINRFEAFPEAARGRAGADLLAERILVWATDLGDADVERLAAARRLIDRARGLPPSEPIAVRVRERRVAVTRALAARLATDEPLQAFTLLADLDVDGVETAGRILDTLVGEPSLLRELEAPVRRWLAVAEPLPATAVQAAAARVKLDAARAQAADPARQTLLAGGDQAALRAALAAAPRDQEVAASLAALLASAGDLTAAVQVIDACGPQGRMTAGTRLLLASLKLRRAAAR